MASDRQKWLDRAAKAARRGDLRKAAECYQELVDAFPDDRAVLQKLCDAQARAGLIPPACANLKRLAELYRDDGDRVRAVALLRRAARLSPEDSALQQQLGNWLLEQGLLADARPHLEAATELKERSGDLEGARGVQLLILDFHPQDGRALGEVLRLAGKAEASRPVAEDCLRVAQGYARRGERQAFGAALRTALAAAPELLSSRVRIERLAADAARAAFLPAAGELGDSPFAAVLRATILCRAGQREEALAAIDEAQARIEGGPAPLAIAAGEVLTDLGRTSRAAELIVAASRRADAGAQREAVAALRRVLRREPGQALAADRLAELSPRSQPRAQKPTPEEPQANEQAAVFGSAERARLLEARSLFLHGMLSSALTQLDALPGRLSGHPEVRELREKIRAGLAPAGGAAVKTSPLPIRSAAPSPAREDARSAPDKAEDGDEWIIDLDDGEGEAGGEPASPEPARPAATAAGGSAAPSSPKTPGSPGGSREGMEGLGELLEQVMSDEDAETRYQMAIGLLEMELADQALPMLVEVAAGGGARCVDAALLTIRHAGENADLENLLQVAETALQGRGQETKEQRADLEVVASRLAQALGRDAAARAHLRSAKELMPDHPGLKRLTEKGEASKS